MHYACAPPLLPGRELTCPRCSSAAASEAPEKYWEAGVHQHRFEQGTLRAASPHGGPSAQLESGLATQ
eukprot:8874999-Alexandrium_andersonii.AAC.1